jgi:alkylhydroperoxidase family enzyme
MRLTILDRGHRLRAKLFMSATARMSGVDTAHGEIDPHDPSTARPELRAIQQFLDAVSRTPDGLDVTGIADLPKQAVLEALHVNLVWNVVNRLANAFGFTLRDGQLRGGTRALHRFGYRFPSFLLADGDAADHGDVVENLRHAVLDAPATTDPVLRKAVATGGALTEAVQSYAATVRDAAYRVVETDIDQLADAVLRGPDLRDHRRRRGRRRAPQLRRRPARDPTGPPR